MNIDLTKTTIDLFCRVCDKQLEVAYNNREEEFVPTQLCPHVSFRGLAENGERL